MNTALSWIKAYVPELDCTEKEYMDAMTLSGTKVEGFEKFDADLDKIIVGKIEKIEKLGYKNLPVCIAKTQYSLSDDPKNLQAAGKYIIHIRDIELKAGAGFVVALAGKIMTMPGLPKVPVAERIDIDVEGNVEGIF